MLGLDQPQRGLIPGEVNQTGDEVGIEIVLVLAAHHGHREGFAIWVAATTSVAWRRDLRVEQFSELVA